ncbi:MAG: restriction endonuclease subunit S [Solimonas sp.]
MASEWRETTWGEEVSLEYGKAIRGYQEARGKFRVFGSNGPVGWTDNALADGPGVILGRKGAYRGVQFSRDPFWVIDTAYFVVPKTELDMRWLYYAIQHYKLGEIDDGSPIPSTTRAAVYVRKLTVPSPEEQHAIAEILGALDDRIDNLRQTNATLQAIAAALFKSRFVDFDGVPPDNMQESELGLIPKGWHWVPARELIDFNPAEPLRKGTLVPYLDMAALPTVGSWPEPPVLRGFGSGMRFRNGDTLLARITPCLENGKTAFVQCLPDDALAWGSTEFIVMRPKTPVPPQYAYLLARDTTFREHVIRSMTGTSGRQRVQADSVAEYKVASPSDADIWTEFAEFVGPLFKSIKANAEQSQILGELRDTLLPKLISGKLRVKGAEPIEQVR